MSIIREAIRSFFSPLVWLYNFLILKNFRSKKRMEKRLKKYMVYGYVLNKVFDFSRGMEGSLGTFKLPLRLRSNGGGNTDSISFQDSLSHGDVAAWSCHIRSSFPIERGLFIEDLSEQRYLVLHAEPYKAGKKKQKGQPRYKCLVMEVEEEDVELLTPTEEWIQDDIFLTELPLFHMLREKEIAESIRKIYSANADELKFKEEVVLP